MVTEYCTGSPDRFPGRDDSVPARNGHVINQKEPLWAWVCHALSRNGQPEYGHRFLDQLNLAAETVWARCRAGSGEQIGVPVTGHDQRGSGHLVMEGLSIRWLAR